MAYIIIPVLAVICIFAGIYIIYKIGTVDLDSSSGEV